MKKWTREKLRWRQFARLLFSRMAAFGMILLVMVIWFVLFFLKLSDYAKWIRPALTILSALIAIFLVCKEENPSYKLTWVLLILLFPLFGGLLYLTMGNKRPSRHMRKRLERMSGKTHRGGPSDPVKDSLYPADSRLTGTCRYLSGTGGFTSFGNTRTDYFPLGEELFARMLSDLAKAEKYIFMEYFIVAEGKIWEQLFSVLSDRAAHGVDVRLIYDDVGSVAVLPRHMKKRLRQAGIQVLSFNPVAPLVTLAFNNRDHRKITVIDGYVAYTGGVNIADEYVNHISPYGHWKDTGLRLCGEAATGFAIMFLDMWNAFRPTDKDYAPFLPHKQVGGAGHRTALFRLSAGRGKPRGECLSGYSQSGAGVCVYFHALSDH